MNTDEFQKKYHDYSVESKMEAISESLKVNAHLKDGKCVPVKIGNKYCLMLDTAASFINELDIL